MLIIDPEIIDILNTLSLSWYWYKMLSNNAKRITPKQRTQLRILMVTNETCWLFAFTVKNNFASSIVIGGGE